MADLALARRGGGRRRSFAGRAVWLVGIATALALAGAPIAYMLWPQAAPVASGAPALPITVGGVTFNVPPGAIRVSLQRRPGTQSRIDLAFSWPSLTPPEPAKPAPNALPEHPPQRLFVTIAASDGTLPPAERLKAIYPRYTADPNGIVGRNGLTVRSFRTGTPYQGEDLLYDPAAPERFLVRCTRAVGAMPGMCLNERRIDGADVTLRFPREWLENWLDVATRTEQLLATLRPAG